MIGQSRSEHGLHINEIVSIAKTHGFADAKIRLVTLFACYVKWNISEVQLISYVMKVTFILQLMMSTSSLRKIFKLNIKIIISNVYHF